MIRTAIVVCLCTIAAACGGTHGNVGQYWVQGTPDEVYDNMREIASDSTSGVLVVDNEDYGLKPYLRLTIKTPGYLIKGITLHVTPPFTRNGIAGCRVGIVDVRRKDGVNCHSGECTALEIVEGRRAAEEFVMKRMRASRSLEFLD